MTRKEVLVQLSEELIKKLDRMASERQTNRSALVRDAVERYIAHETEEEKDRRFAEGYARIPQTEDDEWAGWADDSLRDLLSEESW